MKGVLRIRMEIPIRPDCLGYFLDVDAIHNVSARRQPSSGQSGQQPGKPVLRAVVLNRHPQRLPLTDQHHQSFAARDARINEITLQEHGGTRDFIGVIRSELVHPEGLEPPTF